MRKAVKIGMMAKLAAMMPSHNGGSPSSMLRYVTVTRTTITAMWVTMMCARSGASSVQSMSRRPARRSSSVIDGLMGPVCRLLSCFPAYWVAVRLQRPPNAQALCRKRVGLSPQQVAGVLGGRNGAGSCGLERARQRKRCLTVWPRPHQAVSERQALAPDVVDHRVVGRRAGIGAGEAWRGEQRLGGLQHELHARRSAGVLLVIGDFPAPGGVAAAQHDQRRDGTLREHQADDLGLALAGKRRH